MGKLDSLVSIETFLKEIGMKYTSTTPLFVAEKLESSYPELNIQPIYFKNKKLLQDGLKTKIGINKRCIEPFKQKYISLSTLRNKASKTALNRIIERNNIEVIKLKETTADGFFIEKEVIFKNEAFKKLMTEVELKNNSDYVTKSFVQKQLGLNLTSLNKALDDFDVNVTEGGRSRFVLIKDMEFLSKKQSEMENLFNYYYLASEAKELLKRSFKKDEVGIKRIPFPPILKASIPADKNAFLWNKEDVHYYLKQREIREMNKVELDTPFETFIYRLDINYKNDYLYAQNTKELWFSYVRNYLIQSEGSKKTIADRVSNFSEITKSIFDNIDKEIYAMTTNEINLNLLNHQLNVSHRFHMYQFLKSIHESFQENDKHTKFIFSRLNNPYHTYEPKRELDKDRYSLDEYKEFYNFAKDVETHKRAASKDTINFLKGKNSYHYASVWLYILTLLNNNWRHETVIEELPRINLSRTSITGLEWFYDNNLSESEAKDIIYQVGRHIININKTGAEGVFNISKQLEIPFATAMAICELRLENINSDDGNLIYLSSDKTVNSVSKGAFFSHFPNNKLKFKNRKMNRTLTTLIWSVINSNSNNEFKDGLSAAKQSRSHFNESTTNIYIKLSRKQIDELTEQLFSRDQFGYVYKIFSDVIFSSSADKEEETNKILDLKQNFGDVYKLEATAGFVNRISKEKKDVANWMLSKDNEELQRDYYDMLTNQLPSKEKNYQCIKRECVNPTLNCSDCPFSIPNVYALAELLDKYVSQIENIISFDEMSSGEKKRQANQLYVISDTIKYAKEKFGKDIIYDFLPGGRERIKKMQEQLPPKKLVESYKTIKLGEK
ncbi:hypothetical protein J2Z83_002626 [Virgibacillus natechei]|uniref:Uncharacterized protein n=1 Tax=Virgibacillus natechei TaxID=1216297 RepID=A0ABS4IIU5_9BACI|nr:hypothetical protein [Virgibacillus natechei]MBP1970505.1 hypothetical protein [Virgibacillus natechei]UZD14090.1 hypothetical protein OLD84_06110 [Virgibacillus natechei]